MYLAIDIGGTKTLLAVFDKAGVVIEEQKFPTPHDYAKFRTELCSQVEKLAAKYKFHACAIAAPGQIDHKSGKILRFGNLAWKNVDIKAEVEKVLGHSPVYIQNDAKLAALYEAHEFPAYEKLLYLTISTGIGMGLIVGGQIDPVLEDGEPGQMMLGYRGDIHKWEDLASGRALVSKYGKKASDIDDPTVWQDFSEALALGINELIAVMQPDIIVVGGGVGAHFDKFREQLINELDKLANPMVKTPPIRKAKKAEEAVVYGCYELIKQKAL